VAVLDLARTAVELSDEELAAAAAVLQGDGAVPDEVALEALEAAGVVRNGTIMPYVGRFLLIVGAPKLRMIVERFVAQRVLVDNVWAIEQLAVWGSEGRDGGTELRPVEPPLLPWEIMRTVGLGPRARPAIETTLCLPAATLEGIEASLIAGDAEAADELLANTTDLGEAERAVAIDIVRNRRSSWRASSIWTEEEGQRTASVTVVDGGVAGLWLSTASEGDDDSIVCLEPVLPSAVWKHLVALVPGAPRVPDDFKDFEDD
jgi:hypothetical protein